MTFITTAMHYGYFKPKHTGMGVNERSEEKERLTYGKVTKKKKI